MPDYKDEWENFWGEAEVTHERKSRKFWTKPVSSEVFFRDWLKNPLFPRQQKIVSATFNKDYTMLSDKFVEFIFAGGKGSGKDFCISKLMTYMIYWLCCVSWRSRIFDCKLRKWISIAQAYKVGTTHTLSLDKDGNLTPHKIHKIFKTGKKHVIRIKVKAVGSHALRCTPDHLIMTEKGWKPAGQLKIGDKILVRAKTDAPHNLNQNQAISEGLKRYWKTLDEVDKKIRNQQLHTPEVRKKNGKTRSFWWKNVATEEQKQGIVGNWIKSALKQHNRMPVGFGHSSYAKDGHLCQSNHELKVDNWLSKNNIKHNIHPWIGNSKQADFFAKGWFIEVDGMGRSEDYWKKRYKSNMLYVIVKPEDDLDKVLGFLKNTNSNFQKMRLSEIKSIEDIGEEDCYDLIMDKNAPANFMCGHFVTHNCMNDPQEALGLKSGEPIDIVNIAFDADQAKSVFFEKFIRDVKNTIDPVTGDNFFEKMGMDIDHNIQRNYILFPKNIRAWSMNSKENKSEGKNVIFAIFDEIGSFRFDHASEMRKHIKTSANTRCNQYYKLFYISFLTSPNDYMAYLIDQAEEGNMERTYFDRAATWDVRSAKNCPKELLKYVVKKETYQSAYDEDPGTAMLMYECKVPKFRSNNFIKRADKITDCINYERQSPIIFETNEDENGLNRFWTHDINNEEFEHWFRPFHTYEIEQLEREYEKNPNEELENKIKIEKERHSNAQYYVHIDLSRGIVDCAGIVLGHTYRILDKTKVYVDLALQIRAPKGERGESKEIDLNEVLKFVTKYLLKDKKFPIIKLTADGWNSQLFLNICETEGIDSKIISLEKNTTPYDTLKDFIYRQDINYYLYPPLIRELTELIVTDKHKIDHPRQSKWRMREEGIPLGSKDLGDCLAGLVASITEENEGEPLCAAGK